MRTPRWKVSESDLEHYPKVDPGLMNEAARFGLKVARGYVWLAICGLVFVVLPAAILVILIWSRLLSAFSGQS